MNPRFLLMSAISMEGKRKRRVRLDNPKLSRFTVRVRDETKRRFFERKENSNLKTNGDFLDHLLDLFEVHGRRRYEAFNEASDRPNNGHVEEGEDESHKSALVGDDASDNNASKEDELYFRPVAASDDECDESESADCHTSFVQDHSFLENLKVAKDFNQDSMVFSDDEFEEVMENEEDRRILGPMYESYQWGSGNLMNSCAVDTFLEVMFQLFTRHGELFESCGSVPIVELKQSFGLRLGLGDLHASKVLFWEWLRKQDVNGLFHPGNFISLTHIFEIVLGGLCSYKERVEWRLIFGEKMICQLYDEHCRSKETEKNCLYIRKKDLTGEGKYVLANITKSLLASKKGKCFDKACRKKTSNNQAICNGNILKSQFLKNNPRFIMLNVDDVRGEDVEISGSITANSVQYDLVVIEYLKDDHYFCQLFVASDGHLPGWYAHDGMKNGGCATYIGQKPLITGIKNVEILVYEQVPTKHLIRSSSKEDELSNKSSFEERELVESSRAIVLIPSLVALAKRSQCQEIGCNKQVCNVEANQRGVDVLMELVCPEGHICKWSSSPWYYGRLSNNVLCCTALFLSGGSFSQFSRFQKFLNLGNISPGQFYELQSFVILPAIHEARIKLEKQIIESVADQELIVASDARSDTMGHCAMRGTCSFLDTDTEKWLTLLCGDFREVDRKAPNLEKEKFQEGLTYLKQHLNVKEVVTDASPQVICLMKNDPRFSGIFHSLDVWHKAKKLTVKLTEAASKRENKNMENWIAAIRNHFWYSCENCNGNINTLKDLWMGVVHHIQGVHEWIGGKCDHSKMIDATGDKEWLEPNDPALEAIRDIVLDQNWLRSLEFYVNSRHTGGLETIHSLMLAYCPKHIGYKYDSYQGRMELAYLDYNHHKDRKVMVSQHGTTVLNRLYNRRSRTHFVVEVKESKKYEYIPGLMHASLTNCVGKTRFDKRKSSMLLAIESKYGKTGRTSVVPEETLVLAQRQQSRIVKKSQDK